MMSFVKNAMAAGAAIAMLSGVTAAQAQDARVEIGVLNCTVAGGSGFIFGSTKTLDCIFERPEGASERYRGAVRKFGIDLGATTQGTIVWGVLAPTANVPPGSLSGTYGGVSAEATVGVGVGANALIGGSQRSIILQPVSVSGQEGLNFAIGIAEITLEASY